MQTKTRQTYDPRNPNHDFLRGIHRGEFSELADLLGGVEVSKFKVGQRVAVYTVKGRMIADVVLIEGEKIHVSKGKNHGLLVHSKQCYPIKSKRKARDFLLMDHGLECRRSNFFVQATTGMSACELCNARPITAREVLRGKGDGK